MVNARVCSWPAPQSPCSVQRTFRLCAPGTVGHDGPDLGAEAWAPGADRRGQYARLRRVYRGGTTPDTSRITAGSILRRSSPVTPCAATWSLCNASIRSAKLRAQRPLERSCSGSTRYASARSEEHTSELQSRAHLVCRL